MWTYYAQNREGLCIQFEVARDPSMFVQAVHVEYDEEYPVVNWYADMASQVLPTLLRKHPGWKHEEERRIVIPDGANTALPFRPDSLTAVILGCRASTDTKAAVAELIREREAKGSPTPRIWETVPHASKYKLRIRRASLP
jgi:Protein of unknown function (DUF2971)